MRAGQDSEAQIDLQQKNGHEKFLWLIGSQPHFDNIEFEQTNEVDDLIVSSSDRELNLDSLNRLEENTEGTNYVGGNRTNLLFIDSCFEHIKQTDKTAELQMLECGILGI